MPTALPEPIRLLVERIPERMRAAAAMAVFPALGAYVKDMHLVYADGRDYEPTFMNILVAEQSAGKSAVNLPIEYIIAFCKHYKVSADYILGLPKDGAWPRE